MSERLGCFVAVLISNFPEFSSDFSTDFLGDFSGFFLGVAAIDDLRVFLGFMEVFKDMFLYV